MPNSFCDRETGLQDYTEVRSRIVVNGPYVVYPVCCCTRFSPFRVAGYGVKRVSHLEGEMLVELTVPGPEDDDRP